MKRRVCLTGLLLTAALFSTVGSTPAASADTGISGDIYQFVHTHSQGDLLAPVDPATYPGLTVGEDFQYSSRDCEANAFLNDRGLRLTPNYPGLKDDYPHSGEGYIPTRAVISGTVTSANEEGTEGTIAGPIDVTVCVGKQRNFMGRLYGHIPDSPLHIYYSYIADFTSTTDPTCRYDCATLNGTFTITGGTGRFKDISGGGTLYSQMFCSGRSCAVGGFYNDMRAVLNGTFSDPSAGGQ